MLHDLIAVPQDKLNDFLSNIEDYLILSGGIWRHRKRTASSVSLNLDKYFDEQFKKYIRLKRPQTGAFAHKSIFQLIEAHRHNQFVLISDVKTYFESIGYQHLSKLLKDVPEISQHSVEIEKVYFYNGYLRRGLVASPAISEVIGLNIDAIIKKLTYESGLLNNNHYSRYYDDIVISCNDKNVLVQLQKKLQTELVNELDLKLSQKKTKVRPLSGTKILGLSFHNGEITPPKSFKANLRAAEHQYSFMSEYELEDVYAKMSQVGTIYASFHRIKNSSTSHTSSLSKTISYYYDELHRLHELYEQLLRQEKETNQDL